MSWSTSFVNENGQPISVSRDQAALQIDSLKAEQVGADPGRLLRQLNAAKFAAKQLLAEIASEYRWIRCTLAGHVGDEKSSPDSLSVSVSGMREGT